MAKTLSDFTESTSLPNDDYVAGYTTDGQGGERRYSGLTLKQDIKTYTLTPVVEIGSDVNGNSLSTTGKASFKSVDINLPRPTSPTYNTDIVLDINGYIKGGSNKGALGIETEHGTVAIGPQSGVWCHLYTIARI